MTSTTDTAEHPEVTEISDLAEGLLPPSRTSDIRRHIDGCVLCADVYSSLEEIRGMLGTLPDAPRMPEDVAARIDAALAAEALLDTVTYAAEASPADEGRDEEAVRETEPVSRETSPESPVPAPRSTDRPAGHAHSATGPGRTSRTGRRRTRAAIGAVLAAAAIGTGALFLQNGGGTPVAHPPASTGKPVSTFAKENLETKVSELLHDANPPLGTETTGPNTPANPEMPKSALAPPACIQLGTHRNEDPIAFKRGTYEGKPVYLLVLPDRSDPARRVTAFIVDAACTKQTSSTAGKLLYSHTYNRT
ncbi:hypothetical protein [Streptomyces sp. VRA16 Mangrove soil]|uniref:hypothetical protein n=1 Tax=Streptomyces sp. VRA16 Mangrove soil TaxID=2817434 RepID=UPI001A9E45C6|nr:hypothetical protein [Streptomyces sp. VRA16 Mangrove soil]MBO1336787.1 hypothetical protein [Streptomyces sp. VRA16 Mangrove soil]